MALFGPAWQASVQCQQRRCPRLPHSMPSVTASCAPLSRDRRRHRRGSGGRRRIYHERASLYCNDRGLTGIAKLGFAYLRITSL
jgi:hypothetical protein